MMMTIKIIINTKYEDDENDMMIMTIKTKIHTKTMMTMKSQIPAKTMHADQTDCNEDDDDSN